MKTTIIAEAGVNHNGSLKIAKKLVDVAKKANADYIKFQSFDPEQLVTKNSKKAKYQLRNTGKKETQQQMLKKLTLSYEEQEKLFKYCKKKKIKFICTSFDINSLKKVLKFNVDYIKIPSGEITNFPFLNFISKLKKKIILSTGASNMDDIKRAYKVLKKHNAKIIIMHCNSAYPTPLKDCNLNALKTIKNNFKTEVGYSDHTTSLIVPIIAISLGAKFIEKHFTLRKTMSGPDHKASLEPKELINLIKNIRKAEISLGKDKKIVTKSEIENRSIIRKSIVCAKLIKKGEKFTFKNIAFKRPGTGLSPFYVNKIVGRRAKKNMSIDEQIKK
tara:strand:- start:106 stop:1098 length:993 start_codon:yes stop_codon:yes gene_type:complete